MLNAIAQGILLGMLLSVFVGPVFFLLIQTSIIKGFKHALIFSLGIVISDTVCILLAYFVAASALNEITTNPYFISGGGVVFILFGIGRFMTHKKGSALSVSGKKGTALFFQGMFFNLINPSVLVFWLGAMVYAMAEFEEYTTMVPAYFVASLCSYFVGDILKIYGASRLKRFLTEKVMKRVDYVVGISFIAFGLMLVYNAFSGDLGGGISQ